MSTQPLVPTVFSTGAKDSLATVDTYKSKPGPRPINSIQALSDKMGFDVSSILGGVNATAALGTVMKMSQGGQVTFDKNILTTRLLSTSSKITSSYRNLPQSAKTTMANNMDFDGPMKFQVNGVTSMVDSYNIDSINSLGSFLGDYTGNKNMCSAEDTDAMGSMVGGLVAEGSDLGIGGVWTGLTENMPDMSVMTKAARTAMPRLIQNGDLSTIYDISGSPAGKEMGPFFPDLARDLGGAFRVTNSRTGGSNMSQFGMYIGSLDNIFNDWSRISGNNGGDESNWGVNLLMLLGGSRSFQDMISWGVRSLTEDEIAADPNKQYYALGGLFKPTTVEAEIKRFFPQTVLISQADRPPTITRANRQSNVDPRTIMQLGAAAGLLGMAFLG